MEGSFGVDSRMQAILASIEQQESEDEGQRRLRENSPPRSLEDFLATTTNCNWPSTIDDEDNLGVSVDTIGLGTLEEIKDDLCSFAPFDVSLLDDLQRQIQELENRINRCGIMHPETRPSSQQSTGSPSKTHVLSPTSVRAISAGHPDEVINKKEKVTHRFGFSEEQSSIVKSIQYTNYPGFFPNEMTTLPGQLEAPQLLNKVIKAQNFPPAFRKVLKKLFLSEASVAILQDTFWWFFLNCFQSDKRSAQDGLFNRIADSFVCLFFGVPPPYKDRFFMHYPDCLAQAVYGAFCEAFPRSYSLFDENFKNYLLNVISEWVTGTKPPPQSWKKWNFKILEPANIRELQDDRTKSLKANMTFDVDTALEEVLPTDDRQAKRRGTATGPLSATKPPAPKEMESHEIGPGPEFERVNFNIFGQSPLVCHYLKMKELSSGEGPAIGISRTEISKQQTPTPTYKQVMDETKKAVKIRNVNYQKVLDLSTQESIKIQRQKQKAIQKLDKLKKDLVLKNQDFKIISDKLMELMSHPDYINSGNIASSQMQEHHPLDQEEPED
ncbi:protein FAM227B-like [Actinia tenebrosa]|uniref:Protein FAM227B-like n=1 Tax=Actinia tenebrosa TaxID=6105 RepID=A0A6P8HFG6_ACTTE|nr:protein FAM227B-like [Actinia tenebrosa]